MLSKIALSLALIAGLTGAAIAQGSCGQGHPSISCPAGQIWDVSAGKCQQMTVIG